MSNAEAHDATDTLLQAARQREINTGMALTLICLILGLARAKTGWFAAAALLLVVNITAPWIFGPASKLWFGLSAVLGAVMSKLILTLVFFSCSRPWASSAGPWAGTR